MSRIGIDIDGVLYDFAASFFRHLDTSRSELVEYAREAFNVARRDSPEWAFYEAMGMDSTMFVALCDEAVNEGTMFRLGEPTFQSKLVIDRLRDQGHDIVFITARDFGDAGAAELRTIKWLQTYGLFVPGIDSLHFDADKTGFGLDYLLEDRVENLEQVQADGTICVAMNQAWNQAWSGQRVNTLAEFADFVETVEGEKDSKRIWADVDLAIATRCGGYGHPSLPMVSSSESMYKVPLGQPFPDVKPRATAYDHHLNQMEAHEFGESV